MEEKSMEKKITKKISAPELQLKTGKKHQPCDPLFPKVNVKILAKF